MGRRHAPASLFILLLAVACGDSPTAVPDAQGPCAPDGSLSVAVYGAIQGEIDWNAGDLSCSGMPRPDGAGARMHFAGTLGDGGEARSLAFIISLPELGREQTARETPARITLMEENNGRFFSTAEAPVCWSDVSEQRLVQHNEYAVRGIVYCVAPLAELNGSGGVTLTDFEYRGRIDWGETR